MGNDIVMALVMQEDQLFVLGASKGRDVEGAMGVHEKDLVTGERRGLTELGQGIVAARPWRDASFVMEVPSETSLEGFSLANAVVFWVLVYFGFGDDEGFGTTEFISIVNSDDRFGMFG